MWTNWEARLRPGSLGLAVNGAQGMAVRGAPSLSSSPVPAAANKYLGGLVRAVIITGCPLSGLGGNQMTNRGLSGRGVEQTMGWVYEMWRCVCGSTNFADARRCWACDRQSKR